MLRTSACESDFSIRWETVIKICVGLVADIFNRKPNYPDGRPSSPGRFAFFSAPGKRYWGWKNDDFRTCTNSSSKTQICILCTCTSSELPPATHSCLLPPLEHCHAHVLCGWWAQWMEFHALHGTYLVQFKCVFVHRGAFLKSAFIFEALFLKNAFI